MADNENTRSPAGGSEPSDLHAAIMNLPCNPPPGEHIWRQCYKQGHRDARHAAAELALASAPASAPLPLTDEQVSDRVADASIDANLSPKWCLENAVSLNAFARALIARECLAAAPVAEPVAWQLETSHGWLTLNNRREAERFASHGREVRALGVIAALSEGEEEGGRG